MYASAYIFKGSSIYHVEFLEETVRIIMSSAGYLRGTFLPTIMNDSMFLCVKNQSKTIIAVLSFSIAVILPYLTFGFLAIVWKAIFQRKLHALVV